MTSNKVYLVILQRGDGHKAAVSSSRHINSFHGTITEQVFTDRKYAEEVLAEWQKRTDIAIRVYIKEIEL
jgi:hypothetical protein